MIFDRTNSDVEAASSIRTNKVQKGESLTAEEVETLERGTLTINTLNRIEDKQNELKGLLNGAGYWNTPVLSKNWQYSDIFDMTEFERIIDNLNILKNAFFLYSDTPATPPVSYHYEDINSIEKILYDFDLMIADMKGRYRQCGTFQCGEVNEN